MFTGSPDLGLGASVAAALGSGGVVVPAMDDRSPLVAVGGTFRIYRGVRVLYEQRRYNVFWGGVDGCLVIIKRGHFTASS